MRVRVDRGIYRLGPCSCAALPKRHETFDLVVSTGRDALSGGYGQVWRRHHGTITSAREARRDLLADQKAGKLRPSNRHTLNDLFDAWLADLDQLRAAPETVRGYRRDANTYWRSALGERTLHRIVRADVKGVADELKRRGVGVHHALSTISAAFSWAVQEEWIAAHEDPTKKIRRPAKVHRLPQVPTPAQVRAVLETADEQMRRFLFLGAVTGCRCGELRGLQVRDIDLSTGVVGLVRAMSAEQPWTLKNRHERPVGLDEVTAAVVEDQVRFLEDRAQRAGVDLRPDAFLFGDDPTGAAHWREAWVSRVVSTLFDHALRNGDCEHKPGEPCPNPGPLAHFTFKSLRKFMDTWGQELGFTIDDVAARAGHTAQVARAHYTGHREATDRRLSEGLAALLSPGTEV